MSNVFYFLLVAALLALVLWALHRKDKKYGYQKYANFPVPEPEVDKFINLRKVDTPLDIAVNEIYGQFEGMDMYFTRMSESTFRSYCHSQLSGGIGMKIRNHFHFWEMHNKQMEKSALYEYLLNKCHAIHPDGMSDAIIKQVYLRYHREHPDAWQEVKEFERYKHSKDYKPGPLPFDVRYPNEK